MVELEGDAGLGSIDGADVSCDTMATESPTLSMEGVSSPASLRLRLRLLGDDMGNVNMSIVTAGPSFQDSIVGKAITCMDVLEASTRISIGGDRSF